MQESLAWVTWSTRETIDSEIPSVTAIIETAVAVLVYWIVAIKFETYLPIVMSVAVAPLVLLRSDESVATGVNWFVYWEQNIFLGVKVPDIDAKMLWPMKAIAAFTAGLIAAATFILFHFLFLLLEGRNIFWGSLVGGVLLFSMTTGYLAATSGFGRKSFFGLLLFFIALILAAINSPQIRLLPAVAGILCGFVAGFVSFYLAKSMESSSSLALKIMSAVVFIPLMLTHGISVFCVGLAVRLVASIVHLDAGIRSLPRNFRRLVLCTSPGQEPEIVPGLTKQNSNLIISVGAQEFLRSIRSPDRALAWQSYVFYPLTFLICFLPAWLYRITLKSTSWFWWPIAFLGGDLKRAKYPDEFRRKVMGSLWAKTSLTLAAVTIAGFLIYNLLLTGAVFQENPLLTVLGYFLLIDRTVFPWQLLTLTIAVLSFMIVFWLDDVTGEYQNAGKSGSPALLASAQRKLGWLERLSRLRFLLALLLWIVVGAQAILYFNDKNCWFKVPANVERWAVWAYGLKTPQGGCNFEGISTPGLK